MFLALSQFSELVILFNPLFLFLFFWLVTAWERGKWQILYINRRHFCQPWILRKWIQNRAFIVCVYIYIYIVEKTSIWYLDLPFELLTLKLGLGQLIGVVEISKISQILWIYYLLWWKNTIETQWLHFYQIYNEFPSNIYTHREWMLNFESFFSISKFGKNVFYLYRVFAICLSPTQWPIKKIK